ncbi:MAG: SusC/RagA family TonB-linked outer membrane protein, partial [Sphingobacteriaceae bacterium]
MVDNFGHQQPGVKISVMQSPGTNTITDTSGVFEIAAAIGSKLVISYPGYYTDNYKVKDTSAIRIQLVKSYLQDPAVIDVLYDTIRKQSNNGAVGAIYSRQLTTTPATSYMYALAGRLAGLRIKQEAGYRAPYVGGLLKQANLIGGQSPDAKFGEGFTGNETSEFTANLRSQAPIIMIDGVQRDFTSLDMDNIESVSVLKDGLSTILLGQQSSRPVLLITTTKPQLGAPRISLSAQTGVQNALTKPQTLSAYEYAFLYNEALQNMGNEPIYKQADFDAYRNQSDPLGHPDVDWFDKLLKSNARISRYNVGLNGGNNTARYVVSLGYMNQEGMFRDYNLEKYSTALTYNRYTVNTNVDVNVTKNFNVALQLFGRIQDGNQPGTGPADLLSALYSTPNNAYPVYNPNGSFGGNNQFTNNLFARLTKSGYTQDYARDVMANLVLKYKFDDFVKGLYFRMQANTTVGATTSIIRTKVNPVYQYFENNDGFGYNAFGGISAQSNAFNLSSNYQNTYAQVA